MYLYTHKTRRPKRLLWALDQYTTKYKWTGSLPSKISASSPVARATVIKFSFPSPPVLALLTRSSSRFLADSLPIALIHKKSLRRRQPRYPKYLSIVIVRLKGKKDPFKEGEKTKTSYQKQLTDFTHAHTILTTFKCNDWLSSFELFTREWWMMFHKIFFP